MAKQKRKLSTAGRVKSSKNTIIVNDWIVHPHIKKAQKLGERTRYVKWKLLVDNGKFQYITLEWNAEYLTCYDKIYNSKGEFVRLRERRRSHYTIAYSTALETFLIENWAFLYNPDIFMWFTFGPIQIWQNGDISILSYDNKSAAVIGSWNIKRFYKKGDSLRGILDMEITNIPDIKDRHYGIKKVVKFFKEAKRDFSSILYDNTDYIMRWRHKWDQK